MRLIGTRTIILDNDADAQLVVDCVRMTVRSELRISFVEHLVRKSPVDPERLFFEIVRWKALIRFLRDLSRTIRPVSERLLLQLKECEDTIQRLTKLLGPENSGSEEDTDAEGQ